MKGLSLTNVKYMAQFAKECPDFPISQTVFGQITWSHNIVLLKKLTNKKEWLWYANKTIENGWSSRKLVIWIESDLCNREGKVITNFKNKLSLPQSDLAQQVTKDPYVFDFLSRGEKFRERELGQGLIDHIQKLLMEFGRGVVFTCSITAYLLLHTYLAICMPVRLPVRIYRWVIVNLYAQTAIFRVSPETYRQMLIRSLQILGVMFLRGINFQIF